ncbi:MAG: S-methyl-5-thioribose-1-phosphate isomerase [Spirochaetaceae bacterium]|jgi:methylthioribose-1-phosphate isomerase|nr:S-methyl-5-thioribose-1-phosphate isomerase [Spirochaetaceae bacterium]
MRIGKTEYRTVWWEKDQLCLINQPLLPHIFEILRISTYQEAARAISEMTVRGAPAIGATAAFAMALALFQGEDPKIAAQVLGQTRPTAQDLFYGINRVLQAMERGEDALEVAQSLADEYVQASRTMGLLGASLMAQGCRVSTHCNAGWLATVDWGTALAPVYRAQHQGKNPFVWVDETRPRCQGSRLSAYELLNQGIDHRIIADNAMAYYMSRGEIDMVMVGADRIALNGDVANKIGTYSSALAAHAAGVPFYVLAPMTTMDPQCASGEDIPIEHRSEEEVSTMFGWCDSTGRMEKVQIAPPNSPTANPAFDITPAELITAIITERGIVAPSRMEALL